MSRDMLREIAKRAGYYVGARSSHSAAIAYDWYPKHATLGNHFRTQEAAWVALEDHIKGQIELGVKLITIQHDLWREQLTKTLEDRGV